MNKFYDGSQIKLTLMILTSILMILLQTLNANTSFIKEYRKTLDNNSNSVLKKLKAF